MRTRLRSISRSLLLVGLGSLLTVIAFWLPGRASVAAAGQTQAAPSGPAVNPNIRHSIHYFSTDSEGNLYVGEDMAFRIQKFVPRPGGSPEQLIGPLRQ